MYIKVLSALTFKADFSRCILSLSEVTVHIICVVQPSSIKLVSLGTVPIYCPVSSWQWRFQKLCIWLPLTWVFNPYLEKALEQISHGDSWHFCDTKDFVTASHSHCSAFLKWWACCPDRLYGQTGKQLVFIVSLYYQTFTFCGEARWLWIWVYVKQPISFTLLYDYCS